MGYARRNFLVPIPRCASWQELNAQLMEQCRKRRERRLRGHEQTIGERFQKTRKRCCHCRPFPMKPARSGPRESLRCRWSAIATTIIRCRRPMVIARC